MVTVLEDQPITEADRPYVPQGNVCSVFPSRAHELLIEGPAGTGKTRAILELLNARAMKYPHSRHLILRKTRASLTESVLVTFEEKVLPEGSPICQGAGRLVRHSYTYPNESTIVVGGLDRPESTFSTEYDTIAVFEATECTENDWQLLFRALRNNRMNGFHQAVADCNPGAPTHWLNQRANAGVMERIVTRHQDNPLLYNERKSEWTDIGRGYIETLDRLTGARKERLRHGRWVAAEGVVYDEFDRAVHVIDRFDIPREWRRIRSIDFGYTNPFVCQWWAIDHDGRMYLYREIYHSQRLVEDHARDINRLTDSTERVTETVADHDAEDRATLLRHGVRTRPAQKSIETGIEAVKARLRPAGDGRPRLFIMRDCLVERDPLLAEQKLPTRTDEEFDCYLWHDPKPDKAKKEEPVDKDNHGMDGMRYAVMAVDKSSGEPFKARRIPNPRAGLVSIYG